MKTWIGDTILALRPQRNSMEAIKFEKGLENKENFISQRLEMGIPLKEGSISKVDEGKRQYVFKNLKKIIIER